MISMRRHLSKNRPGLPQKPLVKKERGPKDPAAQGLNGVVAPFSVSSKLLRQLLIHEQDLQRGESMDYAASSFFTDFPTGCKNRC